MRDRSGAASSWLASPDTQPQHPESYTPAPGHKSPTEQSAPPGLSQQESPARQQHPSQQQQQQFPQPHQMQQAPEGHQYGLVAAVKESFAFLRCAALDSPIWPPTAFVNYFLCTSGLASLLTAVILLVSLIKLQQALSQG